MSLLPILQDAEVSLVLEQKEFLLSQSTQIDFEINASKKSTLLQKVNNGLYGLMRAFKNDFCVDQIVICPVLLQYYHKMEEQTKKRVHITNQKPAQPLILAD